MEIMNDEKPRVILTENKIIDNIPQGSTVFDEHFDVKKFKKKFQIVIVRHDHSEMEFDLIGIHPFLANTFRRLILSDVPTMAIDKVHILNNTSIIQDEVLAHRLGLIPIKADPRLFESKPNRQEHVLNLNLEERQHSYLTGFSITLDKVTGKEVGLKLEESSVALCLKIANGPPDEKDTLEFELKIKCSNNKDSSKKDSSRAEDMYKNPNVYSKHLKWIPIGNQKSKFKESDVGPIHPDILIAKMRPGHELDLKLFAIKSNGKDHAKFSPVATAFYRLLPDIRIVKPVEGDAAYRLQKCFSQGVISIRTENDKRYAVVNESHARYDTSSRNVFRYDDLKDTVIMSKVQDHFIFTIESVGALPPEAIFREAVNILKDKCSSLLNELNS